MKNLILALVVAAALPALAMPAMFRPGVGPPETVSTHSLIPKSQVYLSIMPWGSGGSVFYDFAVVDPEACHDLDEPVLRKAEKFWLIGGDLDCYLFR